MASISFVDCYIMAKNTTMFVDCYFAKQYIQQPVPCGPNIEVRGVEWFVPQVVDGIFKGYITKISTTQPTPDSVKTVRIYDAVKQDTYWIIIPLADDETLFTNNCNECCGSTPSITPSASDLPQPILAQCPCIDANGNYVFSFGIPPNPNGLNYQFKNIYFDGSPALPDISSQQFSTVALGVIALNYHWGSVGTWVANSDDTAIILTAANTQCVAMDIELAPANYCYTFSASSFLADAIEISGTAYDLPGIVTVSASNPNAIVNMLKQVLVGTFTLNVSGSPATGTLQYTGTQIPGRFYYNGSPATAGSPATTQQFTAGAC